MKVYFHVSIFIQCIKFFLLIASDQKPRVDLEKEY